MAMMLFPSVFPFLFIRRRVHRRNASPLAWCLHVLFCRGSLWNGTETPQRGCYDSAHLLCGMTSVKNSLKNQVVRWGAASECEIVLLVLLRRTAGMGTLSANAAFCRCETQTNSNIPCCCATGDVNICSMMTSVIISQFCFPPPLFSFNDSCHLSEALSTFVKLPIRRQQGCKARGRCHGDVHIAVDLKIVFWGF